MLVPPENFGLAETGLYRCSKIDTDNFPFLETLNLKTILLLDAENPPRPLKQFIGDNGINLINLGGLKITNHNHTGVNNRNSNNREEYDKTSVNDRSRSRALDTDSDSSSRSNSIIKDFEPQDSSPLTSSTHTFKKEINVPLVNLNTTKKNDQWMLIEKNLIKKAFEIVLNKSKYNILIVDSTSTLVSILRKIQKWNFNSIVNEFRIYNGSSAKSNYFAENFLELLDIELIAYEIDQLNKLVKLQQQQQQKADELLSKSPELYRSSSYNQSAPVPYKNNADDENVWFDDTKEMIDDDDIDDELLSASPQIPENLLKIVENKRHNLHHLLELSDDDKLITPGTSPQVISNPSNSPAPNESLTTAARHYWHKRRPSLEPKVMRPIHNTLFRNSYTNSNVQLPASNRSSFENVSSPQLRRQSRGERKSSLKLEELIDYDEKRTREKYDFKYYKNMIRQESNFDDVGHIRLKLPPNHKLPEWFVRQRDFWELSYNRFNLYK